MSCCFVAWVVSLRAILVFGGPDLIASVGQVHGIHKAEFPGDILAKSQPCARVRLRGDQAGIDAQRAEVERAARFIGEFFAGLAGNQCQRLRPGRLYFAPLRL